MTELATELRHRLREAGFCPLPCTGKRPAFDEWQKRTDPSPGDIDLWATVFPHAGNTGILTRLTPALDIDILNPDAAEAIEQLARARLEESGYVLVRIGRSPKRAILMRTDQPFRKITATMIAPNGRSDQKIELLCDGQQLVAFGTHPDTTRPYTWHGGEPGKIAWADLPYIGEAEARALVEDAAALLVAEHGYTRPQSKARRGDGFDAQAEASWADLITNVVSGRELHDTLRDLAAKCVAAGMGGGATVNMLRGLMASSTVPHDQRWQDRLADIPRMVSEAQAKFSQATAPPVALPFIAMTDWDATATPERQWAVRDRIPLRQPALFSGEGAVGKSIVELQLCVAHVLGRNWIGALPQQGPAIYLGAEDDADELRRRLAAIANHYGASFTDLIAGGFHLLSFAGEDVLLGVPNRAGRIVATPLFAKLVEAAGDIKPKHIGIDTSADTFGGNENDRSQVRQFVGLLRKLAIVADGSVVLLGHPSLTGISTGSGLSGSTAWHNSMRSRFYLTSPKPIEGEQPDGDLRVLQFLKNNYGRLGDSIVLRYRDGVYVPEPSTSFDQAVREQRIEEIFLTVLRKLIDRGQPVSPNKGPTYAPAIVAEHRDGKAYTSKEHAGAMSRLLDAKKIYVVTTGSPARLRSRLVIDPP
jgi:RecA-family ATPase